MKKSVGEKEKGRELPLVEEFFSLQGEGFHVGKAAYFVRLGGCDIGCSWCDSPFTWNPDMHPLVKTDEIISNILRSGANSAVVTGGEPLMWNLEYLSSSLNFAHITSYLETSGAYPLTGTWNWISLSPKKNMPPGNEMIHAADELKVIISSADDFEWAEKYRSKVDRSCALFLQPEWSRFEIIISDIVEYIKKNPAWRISLQAHKYMHIP
jgi:7-carboxy-7-deazaguanine synthase